MESLKKNDDFRKCYNTGKSYVNRDLVLYGEQRRQTQDHKTDPRKLSTA